MSENTKPTNQKTCKPVRDGFGEGLLELGALNRDVVALSADLTESVRMQWFADKYPERFIQVGIAEQNMAGVAAGLALAGKIPFIGTFACFQPMRNLDQVRTSICMMNANVKMLSSHAGFSHGADGVQIQVLEDLAIMRALPNVTVLIPADAEQAKQMAIQAADIPGPVYIRLGRQETKLLKSRSGVENPDYFVPGKAQILRPGSDVVLIACGYMVNQCLDVAEELAATGVHICVMNMHTLKPLDTKAILDAASSVKKVITVEEHQKAGGLTLQSNSACWVLKTVLVILLKPQKSCGRLTV
jgi:transketolase